MEDSLKLVGRRTLPAYTVFEGNSKAICGCFRLPRARNLFVPSHRIQEHDGHFSPDGHWVAYVSDESEVARSTFAPFHRIPRESRFGYRGQISYFRRWRVQPLMAAGRKGALLPRFRHQGSWGQRDDASRISMRRASVSFFQARCEVGRFGRTAWAPSPDGKRFLFLCRKRSVKHIHGGAELAVSSQR